MAITSIVVVLLTLLLCSSSPSAVLSRPVTHSHHTHHQAATTTTTTTTTTLDVSASIQQTLQVLSTQKPQQQQQQQQQQMGVSETQEAPPQELISVTLHPRSSLHAPAHEDYRSLTLARLRRDSARVRSLTLKHDLALNGVKKSDLKPTTTTTTSSPDAHLEASDLEGPIISGMSQGSGEYFSRVGIGRPPKSLYMVLDTGSDVTWVQCAPCTDCYQQADPIYQPSASSSFSSIPCDTPQCQSLDVYACRNNSCLYQVSYGDGSYTVGDYVSETLTLGTTPVENIAIGCGHDNEGLFVGAAGLLGLGGGALSFPSQTKSPSFSYCLVDRDSNSASTLQLGAASFPSTAATVTTPLLKNSRVDTFYYVELAGIGVGGETVGVAPAAAAAAGAGRGDCGLGDGGDEAGDGGVRGGEGQVQGGCGGAEGGGRGGAVRHVLRSEWAGERERAYGGLAFRWGEVGEASGQELSGAGGFCGDVLFCVRADVVGFADYWERAAAGDSCGV
ncbi:hypothetical protein Scep_022482 [Stephania cephalantha]|uniref:Peptidase A1 domain-containing protein n=1 Tax=Stephania cephalantha TaxID=152367 RepID=A0AAP0FFA9_9MAGN